MRSIFILRGAPASGKSTWIKENNLGPYTISADSIRLLFQTPSLDLNGDLVISQNMDYKVWRTLFRILEEKMSRGEFIIIDATHYKKSLLMQYNPLLKEYRYRPYIIDFTDVPKEELYKRNRERPSVSRVPEKVIDKMTSFFNSENLQDPISKRFKILKPKEAIELLHKDLIIDLNNYDKIVAIGDIHGCYTSLMKYFGEHPMEDNNYYIFLGDYLERGIENKEVLDFLLKIKNNKNVLFLEGNHEDNLRKYVNRWSKNKAVTNEQKTLFSNILGIKPIEIDEKLRTENIAKEFYTFTIPQIKDVDKKEIKIFCSRFAQMAYFTFKGKKFFITHGGITSLPSLLIATNAYIRGIGKYEEIKNVYDTWQKKYPDVVMIHGHRNISNISAEVVKDNIYNLDCEVEKGGNLRILEITDKLVPVEIRNDVYDKERFPNYFDVVNQIEMTSKNLASLKNNLDNLPESTNSDLIKGLNESSLVNRKVLHDNIVSYNFSKKAFFKKAWSSLTCKARGLFIYGNDLTVAARSYDKFFNIGELEPLDISLTKMEAPIWIYRKENGFLGLVSYNKNTNDFLICSKSMNFGPYADMVREEFYKKSEKTREEIKEYLKDNNVTFIFEIINPEKDPHIITYDKPNMILLDIVSNSLLKPHFMEYNILNSVATKFKFSVKKELGMFTNLDSFREFYKKESLNMESRIEGWVARDNNGFMLKFKTPYYRFWKKMRGYKDILEKGNKELTMGSQHFSSGLAIRVADFMKTLDLPNNPKSIIEIRDLYAKKYPNDKAVD